ncbi:hypothetical protein HOP52_12110 [Halomonas campisalis]|uniref:Cache domain-containing protein n=1 Tax=Billgrantia campisalis TaxID=74661 RepID=A0ABS9P9R6_9GAMM|nr:hypothetical protein [Halomonas campisalis]MCG6658497.1 hypothetical protein [Halomonas campisalis]MDR5863358.1 hypothetical protein [Halomonas campisalis]
MLPPPGPARAVFGLALLVAMLGFSIAAGLGWVDRNERQQTTDAWLDRIQFEAVEAAESLNTDLRLLSDLAYGIASDLARGELPVEQIEARLEALVERHPEVFGVGVMFRPYAYAPDQRLYAPYIVKRNGVHEMLRVDDVYDYTQPEHEWFRQGITYARWHEPFFGEASQAMLALYCIPFRLPEEQRVLDGPGADGTVCIDYSIEDIWGLVGALDLGQTGYAFVITDQSTFVAHPRRDYVRQGRSLYDIAAQLYDPVLMWLAEQATDQRSGVIDHSNELTGQDSRIYYGPITATNWSLAVVAFTDEIPLDIAAHKQRQIAITIVLIIGAIGLIVMVASYRLGSKPMLWSGSFAIALLFLVGVANIWLQEFAEAGRDPPEAVMLVDLAGVQSYLDDYEETAQHQPYAPTAKIPTGVFVQAIRFESPHDFVVTGFAWQRYTVPDHDDVQRGIFFPDAIPTLDRREELFRFREGDAEVVGWFFKSSVHQPMDYSRFPIDVKTLKLRVWHPDMARNVVLVPELGAYRLIHPTSLPGVETGFRLPGWQLQRSFFAYRFHDYRSDLGIRNSAKVGDFPELTYNLTLRRNITDAFISNLIPLFVAALMLFAMLAIDTRDKVRADLYGFNTIKVLATTTAIFFVILLAHIDVRRRYVAEQIMYLEFFFFITYFTIVAVSFNAFMLATTNENRFFHYRDNLIPKLLFWPLLHGAFFVVTVYVFL